MTVLNPQDLLDIYSVVEREAAETGIFTVIKRTLVSGSTAVLLTQDPATGKVTVSAPFPNVLPIIYTDGVTMTGDGSLSNPIRRIE